MTPRVPWPRPARRPAPAAARTTGLLKALLAALLAALPAARRVLARRPAATAWEGTRHTWESAENTVLARLADAGGDLAAHRTVHLEDL